MLINTIHATEIIPDNKNDKIKIDFELENGDTYCTIKTKKKPLIEDGDVYYYDLINKKELKKQKKNIKNGLKPVNKKYKLTINPDKILVKDKYKTYKLGDSIIYKPKLKQVWVYKKSCYSKEEYESRWMFAGDNYKMKFFYKNGKTDHVDIYKRCYKFIKYKKSTIPLIAGFLPENDKLIMYIDYYVG